MSQRIVIPDIREEVDRSTVFTPPKESARKHHSPSNSAPGSRNNSKRIAASIEVVHGAPSPRDMSVPRKSGNRIPGAPGTGGIEVPFDNSTDGPTRNIADYGNDSTLEYWIDHPIRCGYLLAYCESQYSAENIRFIMEIDRFRDLLSADKDSWGNTQWRAIDQRINLNTKDILERNKKNPKPKGVGPEELELGRLI